jgi:hypothetical protein
MDSITRNIIARVLIIDTIFSFLSKDKQRPRNYTQFVKPNEKMVKCSWVKFKWEEVKCRKG